MTRSLLTTIKVYSDGTADVTPEPAPVAVPLPTPDPTPTPPITVPPVDVPPVVIVPPVVVVPPVKSHVDAPALRAGEAWHDDAGGLLATWAYPDGSTDAGYSTAHVFQAAGTYTVARVDEAGTQTTATVVVSPDTRPVLPFVLGQPFQAETIYDGGNATFYPADTVVVDQPGVKIRHAAFVRKTYAGSQPIMKLVAPRPALESVAFDTAGGADAWSKIGCGAVEIGTTYAIQKAAFPNSGSGACLTNVVVYRADTGLLFRDTCHGAWVDGYKIGDGGRSYGIFVEGADHIAIRNADVQMLHTNEHGLRLMSGGSLPPVPSSFIHVVGGTYRVQLAAAGKKQPGAIEARETRRSDVIGATCIDGQLRTGPYGSAGTIDDGNPNDVARTCQFVLIKGCTVTGSSRIYVRAGSQNIAVQDCKGPVTVEAVDPAFPTRPTSGVTVGGGDHAVQQQGGAVKNLVIK